METLLDSIQGLAVMLLVLIFAVWFLKKSFEIDEGEDDEAD